MDSGSLETFRNQIRGFNPEFPYAQLPTDEFCEKVGIAKEGVLTYGGLLMLGKRDSVQRHVPNFWIDYIEIPGSSYRDAGVRYTYRMPEQANIWESYQIILQRLRIYCEAPYVERSDGRGVQDETQLYALREGLTNLCSHCDYFSPMHPVIRVFTDRIEMQNPGKFIFPLSELRKQIHSMLRNPILSKLFRFARLSENAGYGIDKMLMWEQKRGKVDFTDDVVSSTIIFYFERDDILFSINDTQGDTQDGTTEKSSQETSLKASQKTSRKIIELVKENANISTQEMAERIGIDRRNVTRAIHKLREAGIIHRVGPDKGGHWKIITTDR